MRKKIWIEVFEHRGVDIVESREYISEIFVESWIEFNEEAWQIV